MAIHFKEIDYGFEYGNAVITRIHSDDKRGWVLLNIKTDRHELSVYVTKAGRITITDGYDEYKPARRKKI